MARKSNTLAAFLFTAIIVAGSALSCLDPGSISAVDCDDPNFDHSRFKAGHDPCGVEDAGNPLACAGECVPPGPPPDWMETPVNLWHGPRTATIPTCPEDPLGMKPPLGRDPLPLNSCPLCKCSDPTCVLPHSLIADADLSCSGGPFTPFPADPLKSCSNKASLDANTFKSIAIEPPTVSPCKGSMAVVPAYAVHDHWNTVAVVCNGARGGICSDPENTTCTVTTPPGFVKCIQRDTQGSTDSECPPGYPVKHVYYNQIDYDTSCTPCDCSPPYDSVCKAEVAAYSSNSCTAASNFLDVTVVPSPGPPPCYAVQPNTALRGMTETWVDSTPGKCDPLLSVPIGKTKPLEASAWEFCCSDTDFPDP